jgi:hypothetical protein
MTRERDRYRRASLGEQVREGARGFWRNRAARLVTAVLLGGFLILRMLTPAVVPFAELRTGDCVYLRPPGPAELATSVAAVPATTGELLAYEAAERADCNLSHSHEVSEAFSVGDAGAVDPGVDALRAAFESRCEAALEAYIGSDREGAPYATVLAVPGATAWADGARYGVCFVFNADRTLLDHHARGSGA